MPTDPKNLKNGQRIPIWVTVEDREPNRGDTLGIADHGHAIYRADIITDYPPEPSAEGEWDNMVFQRMWNGEVIVSAREDGYEYRVQRRPIKPAWVLEVGDTVVDDVGCHGIVRFVGKIAAVVDFSHGTQAWVSLDVLTKPPEDAAK